MPADEMSSVPSAPDLDADVVDDGDLDDSKWAEENSATGRERTMRAIVAAIILIIVVILVLLLLRTCSNAGTVATTGEKTIVAVPPKVRLENVVSVWLKPGASLRPVLSAAKIKATSTRAMGDGLYFVFLPDGQSASVVVTRLKSDSRVYDAGFAYDDRVGPIKASQQP